MMQNFESIFLQITSKFSRVLQLSGHTGSRHDSTSQSHLTSRALKCTYLNNKFKKKNFEINW